MPTTLADVPAMRLRLPALPALHDLPQILPPSVGHWIAERLGLSFAYGVFCDHCTWEGWEDGDLPTPDIAAADAAETPGV